MNHKNEEKQQGIVETITVSKRCKTHREQFILRREIWKLYIISIEIVCVWFVFLFLIIKSSESKQDQYQRVAKFKSVIWLPITNCV